jgi:hypothetical protein
MLVYNTEFEQNWALLLADRWTDITNLTSCFKKKDIIQIHKKLASNNVNKLMPTPEMTQILASQSLRHEMCSVVTTAASRASAFLSLSADLLGLYLHYFKWHKTLQCSVIYVTDSSNFQYACKLHNKPLVLTNPGPVSHSFMTTFYFPMIKYWLRTIPWRYRRGTEVRLQRLLMSTLNRNEWQMSHPGHVSHPGI